MSYIFSYPQSQISGNFCCEYGTRLITLCVRARARALVPLLYYPLLYSCGLRCAYGYRVKSGTTEYGTVRRPYANGASFKLKDNATVCYNLKARRTAPVSVPVHGRSLLPVSAPFRTDRRDARYCTPEIRARMPATSPDHLYFHPLETKGPSLHPN